MGLARRPGRPPAPPRSAPGAASTAELVATLGHRNGWHRDTAARLLYERQDKAAVPLLEKLVASSPMPEARVHALYALAGLKFLSTETLLNVVSADTPPRVLEHAIRLVEMLSDESLDLYRELSRLASHADPRVRYQLALTAGVLRRLPLSPGGELLRRSGGDRWLRAASLALAAEDPLQNLQDLLGGGDEAWPHSEDGRWMVGELSRLAGRRNRVEEVTAVLRTTAEHRHLAADIVTGLSEGLATAGASLRERLASDPETVALLDEMLADARRDAAETTSAIAERLAAIRLLPAGGFSESAAVLTKSLGNDQPQEVQLAALAALDRFAEPGVAALLVNAWSGMTPAVRTAAANVVFARPERTASFLDAVDAGRIKPADVDRARLQALAADDDGGGGDDDDALRDRARRLLVAGATQRRQDVFAAYRPALSLAGDAARGKATFEATCAACHRVNGVGQEIGPNLAAMKSRGTEVVLLNVINPNAEVNPLFVNYVVRTKSGRTTSGMLASETAGGITLKRAGGETETVSRADVQRMRSSGLSIMPEGLEQGLDHQAMADLIAYFMSAE